MTSTANSSCHILIYGRDEVLLNTRKALLAKSGFSSDTTLRGEVFADQLKAERRRYCIFIICHSVDRGEAHAITEAADVAGIPVYVLSSITMPDEFLKEVRRLVESCSLAATLVPA